MPFLRLGAPLPLLVAGLVALTSGLAGASERPQARCPQAPAPARLTFQPPVVVDSVRSGGEPVVQQAADGSLLLASHAGTTLLGKQPDQLANAAGFATGYTTQALIWRSTDTGETWNYTGLAGLPVGPHSPGTSGFSDPDLTRDAAGTLYGTEINLANIAVYSSPDNGRTWLTGEPVAWAGDRPWITAAGPGVVYLFVTNPHVILRSADGGLTWTVQTTDSVAAGKLVIDPLNPQHGLIAPLVGGGAAISRDEAKTWTAYPASLGPNTQAFQSIAVDPTGTVYAAHAGGYDSPTDTTANGIVTVSALNRRTGEWTPTARIPSPRGDALWPALSAGRPGQVAVAWMQQDGTSQRFSVYVAQSTNAAGTTAPCHGKLRWQPPRWTVVNASGRPVHRGPICAGTDCNFNLTGQGDRRLGDYFTLSRLSSGQLVVATGDTTRPAPNGGPQPVSNPVFIVQRP